MIRPLTPLTRTRLHEDILVQLKDRIIRGDWAAGARLPAERELAAQLNVNRTTVREALHKLESMGLITIRHGSGIFVNDFRESTSLDLVGHMLFLDGRINAGVLQNLMDLRRLLVPEISRLAAENRSEEELRELERVVAHSPEMPIEEKDWRVHNLLARASGNLLFVIVLNAFHGLTRDATRAYFASEKNRKHSEKFHRDILKAVQRADASGARRIMARVLAWTERHGAAQPPPQ